ncbi:MAG: 3-oxoacyl-[acyl-carrier-protein] reductase [Eubacteriales bacterium]|nr:3-oxoacyl-[acyl-carrier-protein] reductase [Eubacteriales bacterium]
MLKEKIAVVTGASRGIGKAIALELAQAGAYVIVNYNGSKERAEKVVSEIEQKGGKAEAVWCNVSDGAACEAMIRQVIEVHKKIDILVNNAGITKDSLLMRMSEADFDRVLDTNLKGTFFTMHYAARYMMKQRSGAIVNISSVVGVSGNAGQVNYAASKAGVIGMTKSAAKELASRGIRVNAVAPGFIDTEMTQSLKEKVITELAKQIPLGHLGKAAQVAKAVRFLASDDADYITGQVLCVDGGMVM